MAKYKVQAKVVRPTTKPTTRSTRGVSKSERGQEAFQANLHNVAPEHQALFRRTWMKFQGSRRTTGKEPYEAFYDWLHEHPEALIELEEAQLPDDATIARAELKSRKRRGLPTEAPIESPARKAKAARELVAWQKDVFRTDAQVAKKEQQTACNIDLTNHRANLRKMQSDARFAPGEEFCSEDFANLTRSAAKVACRARAKIEKANRKRALIEAKIAQAERHHQCRIDGFERAKKALEFEVNTQQNLLQTHSAVKPKRKTRQSSFAEF